MVKGLHRRASNLPPDQYQPGCMWSMFRLLGFQHHARGKTALSEWRQEEEGAASGLKYSKIKKHAKSNYWDHGQDSEWKNMVETGESPRKMSGHTSPKGLGNEKLSSKQGHRKTIGPVSPRLTRAKAVHYLECNDYILPEHIDRNHVHEVQKDHDGASTKKSLEGYDKIGAEYCKLEAAYPTLSNNPDGREKEEETKLDYLKNQNSRPRYPDATSASPQDAAESSDAKTKKLFSTTQGPDYLTRDLVQDFGSLASSSIYTRSGSYPRARQRRSSGGNDELLPTYNQGDSAKGDSELSESHGLSYSSRSLRIQSGPGSFQSSYKDAKERLRDITSDSKEAQFIAMDGILDKIPYGHKISRDGDSPSSSDRNLWKSKSLRERMAPTEKRNAISNFSRSHSLTESLERYSNFLLSNASTKPEGYGLERPRLTQKDGSSVVRMRHPSTAYGRTHSLPEVLEDFSMKEDVSVFHSTRMTTLDANELSRVLYTSISVGPNANQKKEAEPSGDSFGHASLISMGLSSKDDSPIDGSVFCSPQECSSHPSIGEKISAEVCLDNETIGIIPQLISDTEQGEDLMTGVKALEGQTQFSCHQVFQETGDLPIADGFSNEKSDISEKTSELDQLYAQVDSKDAEEFKYIVDVLTETGFYGVSEKQYSPQLPLSPLVFKELEGLSIDTEICTLDAEIDLNHLLLFDLVNEILIENCELSSVSFPWSLCVDDYGMKSFPLSPQTLKQVWPTGPHCLKNVWSSISRLLHGSSSNSDFLVISQDLARKDDLKFEVEDTGIEVEGMVFDELLEEAVQSLLNFSSIK